MLADRGENQDLPVKTQEKLLGLNRSSMYYRPVEPSQQELALKRRIHEIYTDHPYYGARPIVVQLCSERFRVGLKRVGRCMREMGIEVICPAVNLSKRKQREDGCTWWP